jgi:peptidoglycan/LPS O-acetylase OafA/YrhL
VIWSHYVGVFEANDTIQSIFPQMLPRSQSKTVFFTNIVIAFESLNINFGALGVSVFFLITGFLTAKSLDRDNRASYLVKRVFRIYPVYIVGTVILYLTTFAYTRWAGTAMPGARDFVIQASLLRDWLWIPSVDQIGWTLEVQIKMYLLYFLLHKLRVLQRSKTVMLTAGTGAVLAVGIWPYADAIANFNWRAYTVLYVCMFSIVFLIYGLLGTVFYQYFCGRWTRKESIVTGGFCLFCFWMSLEESALAGANLRSYLVGAALFGATFLLRDRIQCKHAIAFISTISFSIYIVHGLNGYYLLSILDHYGINPYISLCITTGTALLLACGLYRFVEKPGAQLLKKIYRKT